MHSLLSCFTRLKTWLPVVLLLLVALPGAATHLLGGEMSYRYLGPAATANRFRYEVTVLIYLNAGPSSQVGPQGRDEIQVGFYSKSAPGNLLADVIIPRLEYSSATPVVPNCPGVPAAPPVTLAKYQTVVELPASFTGYYAFFTDSARNINITNIAPMRGGNQGGESGNMTLYLDMAPPLIPNSSPIFTDTAVAVICQGDTSIIINNALDPDGDRLTYSFGTPYGGDYGGPGAAVPDQFSPPPPTINYAAGYSAARPFGQAQGNYAALNANTGISQYAARNAGTYVVAVDVEEYRTINGREVLVGRTRRDIQLITRVCPASGGSPSLALTGPRSFTIEEGQPLTFPIAAISTPATTAVTVKVNSVLLDGSGGYNTTYNGQPGTVAPGQRTGIVSLTGTGAAGANLSFTPRCGDARATPYDVVVTATNLDCKRKSVSEVFRVTVTRPAGPNILTGDRRVCVPGSLQRTYTAGGPVPASYRWRVQGGTLVGATTGASVQVQWGATAGQGRLVVVGYSALGCPTDSAVAQVELRPAVALTLTPTASSICQGSSVTLQAALADAPAGQPYTWTGGGQTFTGASITVTPSVTTTYTVTSVSTVADACPSTSQITVVVTPVPVAVAGPSLTLCSGVSGQLGTAPVTGVQYHWSPADGLSDASIANPTILLTNTSTTSRTQTYTLTATAGPSCQSTATVAVIVNPAAVATPGAALTLCSGVSGQLGAAPLAGTTYVWSPAAGLSNPAIANPTVTLTNTGTTASTQAYTVTATTASGCVASGTVSVTVNPAALPFNTPPVVICSGGTASLGGPAVAGSTYLWTPATGLNDATASNPTVTLTNVTDAPITQVYTLSVTTATGCGATSQVTVTVNPAPVVNAGPTLVLCADEHATLGTPARPGYTYQWSPATGLSSATVAQPVLTARNTTSEPVVAKYQLTATTPAGCPAQADVMVTINPRPGAAIIVGPASVCPTVTGVAYSAQPVGAGGAVLPYKWRIRGGEIVSGDGTANIIVNWGPASTDARLQVYSINAQQCSSDTTTLPVRVNVELLTAKPTGPLRVCLADGPHTYQTIFTNGSSYSWTIVGGTQVSTSGSSVVVRWDQPGTGQLFVRETSNPSAAISCRGQSEPITVTILPSPPTTLAIQGPPRACFNSGSIGFSLPGGDAASTYAFELNGAAVPAVGNAASLATSTLAPGTYTLTARETNTSGCAGPRYTTSFVIDPRPATTSISGPAFVCPEGLTGLRYTVPGVPGSSYAWTVGGGGTITAGQGSNSITVSFEGDAAVKTVSVIETSSFGCAGPATSVSVRPDQATVALRYVTVDPQSNGKVQVNLAATSQANNTQPIHILRRAAGTTDAFIELGTVPNTSTSYVDATAQASQQAYDYKVELTNSCGTLLNTAPAHTSIRLAATYTPGKGGRNQGTATLIWNAYLGFTVQEYRVYRVADNGTAAVVGVVPGSSTSPLTMTAPTGDPNTPTSFGFQQCFYVEAVQGPNAAATSYVSRSNRECLDVESKLAFYNIITPNHDGQNDVLTISNVSLYPGNTLTIFNRWGKQLYTTTNYRNDWGQDDSIAPGVYYYLFKQANGTQNKGWFEVVK
jgi:gliding motility-associated-like protein